MYRRLLCLLLLPCVLLAQSTALSHAHSGGQATGHGQRPHFHLPSSESESHHGHHHHGANGHHHHHAGSDSPETQPQQVPRSELPSDHDDDAIYVTCVEAAINLRSEVDDDSTVAIQWGVAEWNRILPICIHPTAKTTKWALPPPLLDGPCPLYIRNLTFLI